MIYAKKLKSKCFIYPATFPGKIVEIDKKTENVENCKKVTDNLPVIGLWVISVKKSSYLTTIYEFRPKFRFLKNIYIFLSKI